MKVLVVDDSRAARMLISSLIREFDQSIEIEEAPNGQEAVELYRKTLPKITFLDLTMPVMDGFEALEKIMSINSEATVIILTADIQKKSVDRCRNLGAYEVIKKLPRKEDITNILAKIIIG